MSTIAKLFSSTAFAAGIVTLGVHSYGTIATTMYFNGLSETISQSSSKTAELNAKVREKLSQPKYEAILKDPYFQAEEFTSKITQWNQDEVAYDAALSDVKKQMQDQFVSPLPFTSFSFNDFKNSNDKRVDLDYEASLKYTTINRAESSCKGESNAPDEVYKDLGTKYFCSGIS